MLVPELLLGTFDDLFSADFEKFKWYLGIQVLGSCKPIAKSFLEKADRPNTVTLLIQNYGEESAVDVTVEILKKMNRNNTANKLENAHAERKAAAACTSSSASAPPVAPATILAQQSGVVVAPTIIGSTSGSLNININKA